MDEDTEASADDVTLASLDYQLDGESSIHSPTACALCRRIIVPENDELRSFGVCGDCKFLLLEDSSGTHSQDTYRRRRRRSRRFGGRGTATYSSSDSSENLFSQHLLHHMVSVMRHDSGEDQPGEGYTPNDISHYGTTPPSGLRRWRSAHSDTDSEGFDNSGSLYGGSETNLSFRRYRVFNGDSDGGISFSIYGGESDASADDGQSLIGTDVFVQPAEESNLDSDSDTDTDIDPMHAGLNQWDSDEDEDDEDANWEEAEIEDDDPAGAGAQRGHFLSSSPARAGSGGGYWIHPYGSPESEGQLLGWRRRNGRRAHIGDGEALEESELDFIDGRGFEELLEHLAAATDSSRRGAPPAAASFVKSLPRVIIGKEHEKHHDNSLGCAICKDALPLGTEVHQLPCLHLYHPHCILPWLSTRNSCPLCRHEFPTDDKDYEEGKQNITTSIIMNEGSQQDVRRIRHSSLMDGSEMDDGARGGEAGGGGTVGSSVGDVEPTSGDRRRRRLFLTAAPIVSIVGIGIVLALWLRNLGGGVNGGLSLTGRGMQESSRLASSSSSNQRGCRSRRWWSLF